MRDFLSEQCGGKVREMIGSGGERADLMARERIRDEARHFNLGSGLRVDQMMILPFKPCLDKGAPQK